MRGKRARQLKLAHGGAANMHEVRSEQKMVRDVAMEKHMQQIQYKRQQRERVERMLGG